MRVLLMLLLLPVLLCVGCGKKVDTSHRDKPGFVDTSKDPTAIMPKGQIGLPAGTPEKTE